MTLQKIEAIYLTREFIKLLNQEDATTLKKEYEITSAIFQEIGDVVEGAGYKLKNLKIPLDTEALTGVTTRERDIFDLYRYDDQIDSYGVEAMLFDSSGKDTELTLHAEINKNNKQEYYFSYRLIETI